MLELFPDASLLHWLLSALYPSVISAPLPRRECWVSMILQQAEDPFPCLSDAIAAVARCGQLLPLKTRLRPLHGDGTAHLRDRHDRNIQDALAEAFALAWADKQGWGPLKLTSNLAGHPDIQVGEFGWIEAKFLHASDRDNENTRNSLETKEPWPLYPGPLDEPFFKKINNHYAKALKQFEKVSAPGRLVFAVVMLDTDQQAVLRVRAVCHAQLVKWARERSIEHPEVGVVIVPIMSWCEPTAAIVELFDPTWTSAVI